jgi:ADP-heptose:LPS heptosyltransferase
MDFREAKSLDRWVGIPLCFVLSLLEVFKKTLFSEKVLPQKVPQRILFIGLSEMGSNILAYSAIERLKAAYPHAQVYFLVFAENKEAIAILGNIEPAKILTIRNTNWRTLLVDTLKFLRAAKREEIDIAIDMELFSRYSSALAYLSRAKSRVGFYGYSIAGLYRGNLQTHQVQFNPHEHISRNFMALVKALAADPSDQPLLKNKLKEDDFSTPSLNVGTSAKEHMRNRLKQENPGITDRHKIVLINPDVITRLPLRRWPLENYEELTKRLLADPNVYVISIGVGSNSAKMNIQSERHINWVGKTSLRELIDLCSISKVLVSHDSGAVHLASVTSIATVVMFGPETSLLYGPLNQNREVITSKLFCSPCFSPFNNRTSSCRNNACMKTITVDEIFETVKRKLNEK